jgi:hypothetical protein
MLGAEVPIAIVHLLACELALTVSKRWNILIMNWACRHILCIFALSWISNNCILVV